VERKDPVVSLDKQVYLDHQEKVVTMADLDLQDHPVKVAHVDKLVSPEISVSLDTQESKDIPDQEDSKDQLGTKATEENLAE